MRRAKIVATLGPATSSPGVVRALVEAGMDVARLNMSHGSHEDHAESVRNVRAAAAATGRAVAILADLQGPKIRLGTFASGPALLRAGAPFTITTRHVDGDARIVSTTYDGLPGDVSAGDLVLIDDGRVALRVEQVEPTDVRTTVIEGGTVSDHKGLNLPGAAVSVPAMSEKDVTDLRWALRAGVDFVALSFVRSAADIEPVHAVMKEEDVTIPVIAKIEKPQAVAALSDVVDAFDAIMVARGDLGVELPLEEVPPVQMMAVSIAREKAKPVIVATQMLDSMVGASRPTRAEASDVANAVLDGADALMLSGETSVGKYPVEAVETMSRIISSMEDVALQQSGAIRITPIRDVSLTKADAIGRAAVGVAQILGTKYLVGFSETGTTLRVLARSRSPVPLLAFTPTPEIRNRLALVWGVESFLLDKVTHTDQMVRQVDQKLLDMERCVVGDHITIVAGSPPGIPGSVNALRVHRMGDAVGGRAAAYLSGILD